MMIFSNHIMGIKHSKATGLNCSRILSGIKFNTIYHGVKFYKFMNNDLRHFGFQYQLGLNINMEPFAPHIGFSGGLHFCNEFRCHLFWHSHGEKMAIVTIPDDAQVYVGCDAYKTNKLMIEAILDRDDWPDHVWINIFQGEYQPHKPTLQYVKNPTPELYRLAIQKDWEEIQYVKAQTPALCRQAVQHNWKALQYVKEQTLELFHLALQQDFRALGFMRQQTHELCQMAVLYNGLALEYVEHQTEELCQLALLDCWMAIRCIRDPTEKICFFAIKQNCEALNYIDEPTEDMYRNAVLYHGYSALPYVRDPEIKRQLFADKFI